MRKNPKLLQACAALVAALCLLPLAGGALAKSHHADAPGDAAAIAAKKTAILEYLRALPDEKKSLVGVQVNEFEVYLDFDSADRLQKWTGHRPAVLGLELMNAIAVPPYHKYVIDRALKQEAAGGLVALTWHERNPSRYCIRGEFFDCTQSKMDAATMEKVLTDGTPEHAHWIADVDAIGRILRKLQNAGVVVLFRPYHEMNGGWFWWGQKDAYPRLWDALYDELAVKMGLKNLIWVWAGDRDVPDAAKYVPVRHKPDFAGIDVYEPDPDSPKYQAGRDNLAKAFGPAVPFAITEVGHLPSLKVLDAVNPAWVLMWGGEYIDKSLVMKDECKDCNTPSAVKQLIGYDRMLMLDQMPASVRAAIAKGVAKKSPLKGGKAN